MKNNCLILHTIKYTFFLFTVTLFFYINIHPYNNLFLYIIIAALAIFILVDLYLNSRINSLRQDYLNISTELELKADELEALNNVSSIITSSQNIDKAVDYIYKIFNKFTGCDRCFVSLVDKDNETLVCRYEFGDIILGEVGGQFSQDSAITMSFKNKKTIVQTNVHIKTRNIYGDKVAIPLKLSDELVGVVFIESGVPQTFKNINIAFVENLANYAVIAVRNAELFNNVLVQKQEIQALYEQAAAANGILNIYIDELDKTKVQLEIKNVKLTKYYEDIQTGYFQTVMALANSIEASDSYTRGHCQRVMEISCEIGKRMGFNDDQIQDLKYASILHDIGKIGVSTSILNKCGKLTDQEYEEIKKHPLISYNILKDIEFLENALKAVLQHHERCDGTGYPYSLNGSEMCDYAKILGVADSFDAMTSDRPYRKAMSLDEALLEIEQGKGTQFDPEVADTFIKMGEELLADSCILGM